MDSILAAYIANLPRTLTRIICKSLQLIETSTFNVFSVYQKTKEAVCAKVYQFSVEIYLKYSYLHNMNLHYPGDTTTGCA